jgi:hypothetical protein
MKMSKHCRTLIAATVAATGMFMSNGAVAATLTFQHGVNGYFGTSDTTLVSSDPGGVYGALDEVSIDASDGGSPNHVLLRFDGLFGNAAGQIKPTDTIVGATLKVVITSVGSGIIFRDMVSPWNQATATWNSFGDGIQADGIEAVAVPFASIGANNGDPNITGPILEVDVTGSLQKLQSGNLPGNGWALLPFMPDGTNGVDFLTSEAFTAGDRPLLTVEVTPVPEPEAYALFLAGLGLVGLAARRRRAIP